MRCSRIKFRSRSVSQGYRPFCIIYNGSIRLSLCPSYRPSARIYTSRFRSSLAIPSLRALDCKFRHLRIPIRPGRALRPPRTTFVARRDATRCDDDDDATTTCNLHACCANFVNFISSETHARAPAYNGCACSRVIGGDLVIFQF